MRLDTINDSDEILAQPVILKPDPGIHGSDGLGLADERLKRLKLMDHLD